MAKFNIQHFRDKCIGCGSCADVAPDYWQMSTGDGLAILRKSKKRNKTFVREIDELDLADNKHAAGLCPVNIIQVNEYR